ADVLEGHPAEHPPGGDRGGRDRLHRHLEAVRHRAHHDRRQLRDQRDRQRDVHAGAGFGPATRARFGAGGGAVPVRVADRPLPDSGAAAPARGGSMTSAKPAAPAAPATKKSRPKPAPATTMAGRVRQRLSTRLATVVTIVIAVVWTIPTIGLLLSSVRPREAINRTGWWTFFSNPELTFANYQDVLVNGRLGSYFLNSLVITIPSVLFSVGFAAFAAYALSWMNFRGRDWIFIGIFALQIVPFYNVIIPQNRSFTL